MFNPFPMSNRRNPTNVDVNIRKKPGPNTEINDADLTYFRTKLPMINEIYNIILKHLCLKRSDPNPASYNLINNINTEINASAIAKDHNKDLCLSNSTAASASGRKDGSGNCRNYMFEPAKLTNLITSMDNNNFLSKVCLVAVKGAHLPANVNIYGGYIDPYERPNFIDVQNILEERVESPDRSAILCVNHNGNLQCSLFTNRNNSNNQTCKFCERWQIERAMFKSVIEDLLYTNNMDQSLELMAESTHLLPAAIMNRDQYNEFFNAIEEYKRSKRKL